MVKNIQKCVTSFVDERLYIQKLSRQIKRSDNDRTTVREKFSATFDNLDFPAFFSVNTPCFGGISDSPSLVDNSRTYPLKITNFMF